MWINFVATDQEIEQFEKNDKIPLTLGELADAMDKGYRADGLFADLKRRAWKALNSYTHTGLLQLGRRFTGHKLPPAYRDQEIVDVTTSTTTCVLVLVSRFFAVHNFADDVNETDKLIASYGAAARRERSAAAKPAE